MQLTKDMNLVSSKVSKKGIYSPTLLAAIRATLYLKDSSVPLSYALAFRHRRKGKNFF